MLHHQTMIELLYLSENLVQVLNATCHSSALPNGVSIVGPCSYQNSDACNAHCVHNGQVLWKEEVKCLSGDQWSPLPPCNAANSVELIRCDNLTNVSQENLSACIKIKIALRGSTSTPKAMCPEILRLFVKFGKCSTEPGTNCTVSCPYGGFVLQCATSKQENCTFPVTPLCPELKSMKLINCSRGVGEFCKVSLNAFFRNKFYFDYMHSGFKWWNILSELYRFGGIIFAELWILDSINFPYRF
ncbi:uncharacterized protein TNCT_217831 [Trichonephila clavata]|uniref:Sushi domain-containing protein n=1 Tax=Trichonephila clavata TaxID=2740835 RepID=A0A8X6LTR3_TRICU|nr:uncharacterized protein TNCT_217831 [Trichonephila clavata]